jgi:hypothetical protein
MTDFTIKYPNISKRLLSKVSLVICGSDFNGENLHIALWDTGGFGCESYQVHCCQILQ